MFIFLAPDFEDQTCIVETQLVTQSYANGFINRAWACSIDTPHTTTVGQCYHISQRKQKPAEDSDTDKFQLSMLVQIVNFMILSS